MARKARVRDYAAEYARRKELEKQRAAAEGREFSLKKARGHGRIRSAGEKTKSRIRLKVQRLNSTRAPYESETTPEEVFELAEREGWRKVERALDLQHKMNQKWQVGDFEGASEIYQTREDDMPDWLFHYHGMFD